MHLGGGVELHVGLMLPHGVRRISIRSLICAAASKEYVNTGA